MTTRLERIKAVVDAAVKYPEARIEKIRHTDQTSWDKSTNIFDFGTHAYRIEVPCDRPVSSEVTHWLEDAP